MRQTKNEIVGLVTLTAAGIAAMSGSSLAVDFVYANFSSTAGLVLYVQQSSKETNPL